MIQTELRRSVHERVRQFVLFVREIKSVCSSLVTEIDAGIRATRVVQAQNVLTQLQSNILNWPHGSLTNLAVRNEMVLQWPDEYANAAAVGADMQALDASFSSLATAISDLLTVARAAGQFHDINPVTGLETYMILSAPDTNALRAAAVTVRDSIGG